MAKQTGVGTAAGKAGQRPESAFHGAVAPNKLGSRDALQKLSQDKDPFWLRARETNTKTLKELDDLDSLVAKKEPKLNILRHGDLREKVVALTFDDGPHPEFTPQLLQLLQKLDVPATFFVVGEMAESSPQLVRQELAAGFTVANHTYHHVSLTKIPVVYVADEIRACAEVIHSITGHFPKYFRPPGGDYNRDIAELASLLGYTTVLWTDDPGDYLKMSADRLVKRTLQRLSPGCILLLHDGANATLEALPKIVSEIRAQGYKFVSLEDLAPSDQKPRIAARKTR